MKRLLGLILLAGVIYGGYIFYRQTATNTPVTTSSSGSSKELVFTNSSDKLSNLAAVLGASISNTYENGKDLLNNATGGASEPIINQLMTKTQEALKDLPRREAEKIKYEFCKGVIREYENKSTPTATPRADPSPSSSDTL